MEVLLETDRCGNCLQLFPRASSRVTQILVCDAKGERVLPVSRVLTVVFQLPPISGFEAEDFVPVKSLFGRSDNDEEDSAVGLCVSCSDLLKVVYNALSEFITVCKLESQVGKAISALEERLVNGSRSRPFIKIEQEAASENESCDDLLDPPKERDNDLQSSKIAVKVEHEDAPVEINEDIDGPFSPAISLPEQDNSQDGHKDRASFNGQDRLAANLKCPKCSAYFIEENTLLCHRRMIHKELVRIPRPLPILVRSSSRNNRNRVLSSFNEKTFPCPFCHLNTSRTEIRYHLKCHTRLISNLNGCTTCGKTGFGTRLDFERHRRKHMLGWPCRRCGFKIAIRDIFIHKRSCRLGPSRGSYRCKQCRECFVTGSKLFNHRIAVHGRFWRCELCGIKFSDQVGMREHMISHRQKKLYKCKICEKSFDRIDTLRLHFKRFHKNGPPSVAPPPPPIETPEETNHDYGAPVWDNRFLCKTCDIAYPSATELDAHLLESHCDQASLTCTLCKRSMQDIYILQLHMKTHGEIKPLQCFHKDCDKVYRQKTNFFFHLKEKHSMGVNAIISKYPDVFRRKNFDYAVRWDKKRMGQAKKIHKRGSFPCEICGKLFSHQSTVGTHIRLVHEKVRDHLCRFCGKAFARKTYLKLHERLHTTNEMPYKCHLCGKGFRMPGTLKQHLKSTIHSSSKDYVCDICGTGFNRNDNLRAHVRAVHLKLATRKSRRKGAESSGSRRIKLIAENMLSDPVPSTSELAGLPTRAHFQQDVSVDSSSGVSVEDSAYLRPPAPSVPADLQHHRQEEYEQNSVLGNNQHSYPTDFILRGYQYRL